MRIHIGPRPRGRSTWLAAPGLLLGVVVAVLVALATLLTLGLVRALFRRGRGAGPRSARKSDSYAEVIEGWAATLVPALALAAALAAGALASGAALAGSAHAKILVPMDDKQTDHLKAYGLTYWVLTRGQRCEWLLNYRGGSFLLPDDAEIEREANVRGVTFENLSGAHEATLRADIADNNMESVVLEKAPKVAVYIPPNTPPWDDAVTLALEYADVPYAKVWDEEVLRGELVKYDWLHLHHEDFTAQHGKFYAAYRNFPWYQEEEAVQRAMASKLGFAKVSQLKGEVAQSIKDYVARGGFMFGMCSATDTYDIALAAQGVDISDVVYDGDPPDPRAQGKLDFSRTLAFKDFKLEMDPFFYRFSDIDVTQEANARGPNSYFTLFDFSAKNDPVPTMLTQNHVGAVLEFLGQSTGFRRPKLKSGVVVMGEVEGTEEVKYLHGQFGRGTFTFLGGHDPEDYQHMVGDPPTDLSRFKHSPGYRLILNNILFPAAEKKKQRTEGARQPPPHAWGRAPRGEAAPCFLRRADRSRPQRAAGCLSKLQSCSFAHDSKVCQPTAGKSRRRPGMSIVQPTLLNHSYMVAMSELHARTCSSGCSAYAILRPVTRESVSTISCGARSSEAMSTRLLRKRWGFSMTSTAKFAMSSRATCCSLRVAGSAIETAPCCNPGSIQGESRFSMKNTGAMIV
jgi:hypothetical protein